MNVLIRIFLRYMPVKLLNKIKVMYVFKQIGDPNYLSPRSTNERICVCVCVCVRERERDIWGLRCGEDPSFSGQWRPV